MDPNEQTPAAAAPAAAPAPTPEPPKDYEALYRQEVAGRIAERERYRPVAQTIGQLAPEQQQAILSLAQAAADGDTDAIVEWTRNTHRNLTGAEIAAQVAAQVAGTSPASAAAPGIQPPAAPATPAGMTPEQIARLVADEVTRASTREAAVTQIKNELQAGGFTVGTPSAQTIIAYARETNATIPDAIAWYNADLAAQYARSVTAGQQLAGQTPQPAPTGQPAGALPGGTPRERAIARITNGT